MYVSRAVFPVLMVNHFISTNPYKLLIFERSVTCRFFCGLYSSVDKNLGKKFEDVFLFKIANKGTTLRNPSIEPQETSRNIEKRIVMPAVIFACFFL